VERGERSQKEVRPLKLSEKDLEFLVETAAPEVKDKFRLRQIIGEDAGFRSSFLEDEKVFRRLMNTEETLLKISPTLFFDILLRRATKDLGKVSYTVEKTSAQKIPVFDGKDVVELLNKESLLDYLAEMLSSFTEVGNYGISFEVERGVWKEIQFNDMDIFTLMSLSEVVEEGHRFGFYKRIADICLFILGIFPEYAERDYRYPFSGHVRPQIRGRMRISPEAYEEEGRKYYKLAAEHRSSKELALSELFWALYDNFEKATKPLTFIADHYLRYYRQTFFGKHFQ
jgi:hypothetical protein